MTAAFLEQRLDTRITRGARGTPTQPGRTKVYLPDGRMRQNFTNSVALHKFEVSHGVRTAAEFHAVEDLFYVVMFTPYLGFRFRHERDYQLTQANSKLTLISGSNWQINRKHTFGGVEFLRPIYKPVAGTIVVKRTRSGAVTTASATVDSTTGIATISGHAGGDTYTCEGQFDLPVTFVANEWGATLDGSSHNLLVVSGSIELEELRL